MGPPSFVYIQRLTKSNNPRDRIVVHSQSFVLETEQHCLPWLPYMVLKWSTALAGCVGIALVNNYSSKRSPSVLFVDPSQTTMEVKQRLIWFSVVKQCPNIQAWWCIRPDETLKQHVWFSQECLRSKSPAQCKAWRKSRCVQSFLWNLRMQILD